MRGGSAHIVRPVFELYKKFADGGKVPVGEIFVAGQDHTGHFSSLSGSRQFLIEFLIFAQNRCVIARYHECAFAGVDIPDLGAGHARHDTGAEFGVHAYT